MKKTTITAFSSGITCFSVGKSEEQKIGNKTYYQSTAEDAMRDNVLQNSPDLKYTNFILKLGNGSEDS